MNQKLKTISQIASINLYELLSENKDEPNLIALIDAFARDLALCSKGKWDDAIFAFQDALKIKHDDFVSTMYIE
ncbi:MAG: hypothetical protein PHN98_03105 [Smithellaceae bacterium]|nr:hypothetical protein [Smithellaceae bacterium]